MHNLLKLLGFLIIGFPSKFFSSKFISTLFRIVIYFICKTRSPKSALEILFPLLSELESLTGIYAAQYGDGVHPKFKITKYENFFLTHISPDDSVLDIGSGEGFLSFILAKKAKKVIAIEIELEKVNRAKNKYKKDNLSYIHGDATKMPIKEECSIVVMSNVLEHIDNRIIFLQTLIKQFSSAKYLIRVPNFERDWRVPFCKELGLEWRSDLTHFTEHTKNELIDELTLSGLAVEELHERWGELWCLCSIARSAQPRQGIYYV